MNPDGCTHPRCDGNAYPCPGMRIPRLPLSDEYFMCEINRRTDATEWKHLTKDKECPPNPPRST